MAGDEKTTTERPRRNPRNKKAPVVMKKSGTSSRGRDEAAGRDLQPVRADRRADRRGDRPADRRSQDGGAPREETVPGRRSARASKDGNPGARPLSAPVELPLSGAKIVGGPRNEHGTRIARRVTCARCLTSDHVPYVPKDPAKALCRSCAAEVLKTYEAGVRVRTPMRRTACNLCGAPFDLPVSADDDGDPLCPSCLRGFTSWQGSVDVPFNERTQAVVEERLSGALVRRRKS